MHYNVQKLKFKIFSICRKNFAPCPFFCMETLHMKVLAVKWSQTTVGTVGDATLDAFLIGQPVLCMCL